MYWSTEELLFGHPSDPTTRTWISTKKTRNDQNELQTSLDNNTRSRSPGSHTHLEDDKIVDITNFKNHHNFNKFSLKNVSSTSSTSAKKRGHNHEKRTLKKKKKFMCKFDLVS
jgi:hypothetical protein